MYVYKYLYSYIDESGQFCVQIEMNVGSGTSIAALIANGHDRIDINASDTAICSANREKNNSNEKILIPFESTILSFSITRNSYNIYME